MSLSWRVPKGRWRSWQGIRAAQSVPTCGASSAGPGGATRPSAAPSAAASAASAGTRAASARPPPPAAPPTPSPTTSAPASTPTSVPSPSPRRKATTRWPLSDPSAFKFTGIPLSGKGRGRGRARVTASPSLPGDPPAPAPAPVPAPALPGLPGLSREELAGQLCLLLGKEPVPFRSLSALYRTNTGRDLTVSSPSCIPCDGCEAGV